MIQAAKKESVAPHAVAKYLLQITIVFVAYFVAGRLGQATTNIRSSNLGPVWPAYGIALAAILICGYRIWPGVAAGAFLVAFFSPVPHIAAVGQAAGATLAAMTGAFVLHRIVNFHPSLSRLRDALGLIVFGALGSTIVSASIGISVLYAARVHAYSGLGSAWLIYWLGDSTGVLLVTPLILTLPNLFRIRDRGRITELAVLLLLLTATCIVVFDDVPLMSVKLHFLAFAVLPFVMWAAIHFGMSGATLSTLLVATIATVGTALGFGPFAQDTPFTNAVLLDVFFAVLSVSGMTLAAVIAEREQAESDREQLVREQAAMEVRLRLASIVEWADDAIIGRNIDGIVTDWNRGAEELYGYSAPEAIGKPISFLMPSDCPDDFQVIMGKLRDGEAVKHYETVRQKKDGSRVEVSLTVSPIIGTEGWIIGSSTIAHDITERKKAEVALRESEQRFRLAAQIGKMYSFEWDVTTDMVVRSPERVKVLGATEPLGFSHRQFVNTIHPDDRPKFIATIAGLTPENPTAEVIYRVEASDGALVWLKSSGRAFFDGHRKMLRVIGMVADITDLKGAEEALRGSEERLRLAQSAARIGTFERDVRTGIVTWSTELESMYGLPPGSFEGTATDFFVNLVHPDDRAKVMKLVESAFKSGEPTQGDWRVLWGDGSIHWIAGRWQVFMNQSGEAVRMIGVNIDVTERKQMEEGLSTLSRRLIEAQELERARIGRELHDDFGQRLALLAVNLQQMKQALPESATELNSNVDELQKRTAEISVDVQALSHQLHSSKLEYLGIVTAMRGFCREFGEQQKMEVSFRSHDLPRPLPSPEISLSLFRVLQEALHNASKHSGVRHFEVELWGTPGEIHLKVSDSGAGFDIQASKESHGIGLTSMQERLRLVKGELSVESQLNRGTTIHARVPFELEHEEQRAAG